MAKNWTEEEEEHIRQNFLTQTYGELAEHFGVTTKAMESKIRRMGLKKQELLAETVEPPEPEPALQIEERPVPEEPSTSPIESIHKLQRRTEVYEETAEERTERLRVTREAAEREKARREEARGQDGMAKAIKTFEAGTKKLLAGKRAQAAADFKKIIGDPPPDLGLLMRARQFLEAAEASHESEPKLKSADDMYQHAVVLLNDGDPEAALEILDQAASKAPKDDRVPYVRALALARSGAEDEAVAALAAAIDANDVNRIYARNDSDFAPLRGNADFQALVASPDDEEDAVAAEADDDGAAAEADDDSATAEGAAAEDESVEAEEAAGGEEE